MGEMARTLDPSQLELGDVIITSRRWADAGGLFIRLGNFFQRGFTERMWSHATIYAGDGKVIEALPKGVTENNLAERYLDGDHGLRVLRHKNASPEQKRAAVEFCRGAIGDRYEQEQQLYFVLHYLIAPSLRFALENQFFDKVFADKKAFFCSELVAAGHLHAGIYPFERKPRKIMPLDFHNPLLFDLVDEGVMQTDDDTVLGRLRNCLSYSLYIIMAFIFFAVDVSLAFVFLLLGHIVMLAMALLSTAIAIVDFVIVSISKRKED